MKIYMDIKELFAVVKKEKNIIIFSTFFFLALGGILFAAVPAALDGSYYFTVKKAPNNIGSSMEALYHIQVAEKTADYLSGWLGAEVRNSPELSAINDFSSRMVSFEVVGIKFSVANEEDASLLYRRTGEFFGKKINQLNSDIFRAQPFSFSVSELKLEESPKDPFGYVAGGMIFGLFFGFFVAFVKFYYQK